MKHFVWTLILFSFVASAEDVDSQLKAAVQGAQSEFAHLSPWQQKLFSEEVAEQYTQFVRDYKKKGEKVEVDVDIKAIRYYLGFSSGDIQLGAGQEIGIFVWSDPNCEKCTHSRNDVKEVLESRLTNRGFHPVWVELADLYEEATPKNPLESDVRANFFNHSELKRFASAYYVALLEQKDGDHDDEKVYTLDSVFSIPKFKYDLKRSLEVLENADFAEALKKVYTATLTRLGERLVVDQRKRQGESGSIEFVVEGISDIKELLLLKKTLEKELSGIRNVIDKEISLSKVVLSLETNLSFPELIRGVGRINVGHGGRFKRILQKEGKLFATFERNGSKSSSSQRNELGGQS